MKRFYYFFMIAIMVISIFSISGCATATDAWKRLLGISTAGLERDRKEAITRVFEYDYPSAFKKTEEAIGTIDHTSIYNSDIKRHIIAFYYIDINTNTVGIFFDEIDPGHTQVEVVSGSHDVKQFIADKIFSELEPDKK
jgi:hypothetical protein